MKYFTFKNSIKIALTALTLFICAESKAQLKLIHYWDMNGTLPGPVTSGTTTTYGSGGINLSPLYAEYSKIPSSAYLSFGVPATSYTLDNGSAGSTLNEFHVLGNDSNAAAAGNLYIRARSPNTGAGALFTWHLPTTNYENITVSFASELSSAGKGVLSFSYSTNGGTTYSVIPTGCMTPATNPYTPGVAWGVASINLSTITAANNNPNLIIAMTNTIVGATGNYRFDNIAVQGDTVQVSAQNTSCFGTGSAIATPLYGTAPYTYTWAPSGGNAATATGLSAGNYTVSMTDANGIVATATVAVVLPSSPLVANISSAVNVKCFGGSTGSAVALVSGGTAGYTYTWSPSGGNAATASSLAQGSYTLNVTDANSCTTNTTVTITQPAAALAVSIGSVTNVNCFGNSTGSATGTASGGTAGYTYIWSPSGGNAAAASSLAQGTYTLNITDANSCTTNTTVTITQPAALSAVITSTNVNCFGNSTGVATAAVSGGTAGYTYTWSPSGDNTATASSLAQGSYTLNVTDAHSCTTNTTVTITQPTAALSAGISASTNVNCFGNSTGVATAAVSGGTAGYTYTWSPSGGNAATASSLTAGTYTVNVTDANGCTTNTTVAITQPAAALTASISTTVNGGICSGGSVNATVTVNGGIPAYTYTWSPSGGNSATTNSLSAGSYTINITDANSCTTNTTLTVTPPASALSASISVVSNINCATTNTGSVTAVVSGGTPAYTYTWSPSGGNATTATNLAVGTYTLNVTDANSCTTNTTVTITKPVVAISSSTNVNCFGNNTGSASATVSGGTTGYTYTWSPSGGNGATASSLTGGAYTISVTDAHSCVTNTTVTITQPAAVLNAAISSINVNCFGNNTGSATATVTGGTAGYTYTWSPTGGNTATASSLTQGSYTLNVTDAKNCTTNTIVTITQPAAVLSASIGSVTNVNCFGNNTGSASVNVTGGTAGYTYTWSPSGGNAATASSLTAGTYTVNIKDANSCTTNTTVSITQPASTISAVITSTNVACFGNNTGSAHIAVSGGTAGYTYTWSPSGGNAATASALTAASYTVNIKDANGCTTNTMVTITQSGAALLANISASTNVTCNGGSNGSATVSVSGGTAGYTYTWSPSGGNAAVGNNLSQGTYTVNITDANSCTTNTTVTITQPATAVTASITASNNVTCYGLSNGTATVAATGGTGTYTYSWSNGQNSNTATNLSAAANSLKLIHYWDMNSTTPAGGGGLINQSPLAAGYSTLGHAYLVFNNGSNSILDNGSPGATINEFPVLGNDTNSLAADNYYVRARNPSYNVPFNWYMPTTHYKNIILTYAAAASSAGKAVSSYAYSLDSGLTFQNTGILVNGVSATSYTPASATFATVTIDLSTIAGVSNNPKFVFQVLNSLSTATTTSGNSRFDNISLQGDTLIAGPTYIATVTDGNGCVNTASVTITQPPVLTASISASTNVTCFNGNTGSATASVSGGNTSYTYTWSPSGGNATTASNLTAGNYTVNVTDNKGCTASNTVTITQPATAVTASITSQTNEQCNGGSTASATATATGGTPAYTYTWSPSGGNALTASNLPVGTYTLNVTDNKGCPTSTTVTITQPNTMTVSISTFTNVNCNGGTNGAATGTAIGGSGSYTYQWDDASNQTTATAINLGAGVYNCYITDVTCGTLSSNSVTITQPNVMTASVISFTNVACHGNNTGAATVAAAAGSGTYSYQWNDVSNQTTATAINLVAGTYTCVVKDVTCGTTITKTVTITQPISTPTITIAGASAICAGGSTTFTASGVSTYTWTSGPTTATYSVNPTATTSYSVVGTNSVGCTSSMAVVTLTVNTLPIVTIDGTSSSTVTACANTTGTLTANGASTYTWSPGNSHATSITGSLTSTIGFTLTGTDLNGCINSATELINVNPSPTVTVNSATVCAGITATLTASGATTYTWNSGATGTTITPSPTVTTNYTVTGTNGNNCSNTAITAVAVNSLPTITVNSPAICVGTTATLTATGATSYTWNTGATAATITDSPIVTTNYTVTGTDGNNCTNTGITSVTVNSLPSLTVTPQTICPAATATLVATPTTLVSYTWSAGLSSTSGDIVTASPASNTSYSVWATDANGCVGTTTTSISVVANLTVTAVATNTAICGAGNSTTLTGLGASSYSWTSSGGMMSGSTGTNITVTPSGSSTTYTVNGSSGACTASPYTLTVNVNALPTLTITASSATVCAGSSVVLTASGASSYTWSNTGTAGTSITPSPMVTTSYTVTGTNANNCRNSDTLSIIVNNCTTGIENNSSANNQINVYPIPNNGAFTIELADDDYQMVKVYDEIGKEIYSQSLDGSAKNKSLKIDLSSLPNMNGMLTLQIITTSGVVNKKIIVQK